MAKDPTFNIHEINWTQEHSTRIWEYIASNKSFENLYFSKRHGDALIRFVRKAGIPLKGKILDFGCGPGFLLEKLLRCRIRCEGLDFSENSIRVVFKRIGKHPFFDGVSLAQGLPLDLASETFDIVFFIETIEHLLASDLKTTIMELHRIIKKGKYIVITTPNEEDLEKEKILCPECGCIFHRMQHVRSWSRVSLSQYMEDQGFHEVICNTLTLKEESIRSMGVSIWNVLSGSKKPNLIYIGEKV